MCAAIFVRDLDDQAQVGFDQSARGFGIAVLLQANREIVLFLRSEQRIAASFRHVRGHRIATRERTAAFCPWCRLATAASDQCNCVSFAIRGVIGFVIAVGRFFVVGVAVAGVGGLFAIIECRSRRCGSEIGIGVWIGFTVGGFGIGIWLGHFNRCTRRGDVDNRRLSSRRRAAGAFDRRHLMPIITSADQIRPRRGPSFQAGRTGFYK